MIHEKRKSEIDRVLREAVQGLEASKDADELESVRVRFLGRKGALTALLRGLRDVPPEERRAVGEAVNAAKAAVQEHFEAATARLEAAIRGGDPGDRIDVTLPGRRLPLGRLHPLTQMTDEITSIFVSMGFDVEEGPDVEDDYHNFEALNFPPDHPAREMQDTFFTTDGRVLRTHTSPVQIRVMEARKPPLRVIAPGAVYRHDADVTHAPMFFQVEGFFVDRGVTFGDLKGVLHEVLRRIFGPEIRVRFRPSFFPFTEPSAEVDIGCFLCDGSGAGEGRSCRICSGTGWLEILGSGMIDPNVFRAVGYDPEDVSGFAFGMGVERIAMLRFRIGDIRLLTENDLRFLRQF